jgi:hypothetical protein
LCDLLAIDLNTPTLTRSLPAFDLDLKAWLSFSSHGMKGERFCYCAERVHNSNSIGLWPADVPGNVRLRKRARLADGKEGARDIFWGEGRLFSAQGGRLGSKLLSGGWVLIALDRR